MFKVNNKDTRTPSLTSLCCLCTSLNIFTPFSNVFIVDLELVKVCWVLLNSFPTRINFAAEIINPV